MKYFTWDFIYGSEQKNEIEQKEYYEEFRLLQEKNNQNFSNVKNVFSKESLYNYGESGRFHDYEITNLNILHPLTVSAHANPSLKGRALR